MKINDLRKLSIIKGVSKLFEVDITIKFLGFEILHLHFPPCVNGTPDNVDIISDNNTSALELRK